MANAKTEVAPTSAPEKAEAVAEEAPKVEEAK